MSRKENERFKQNMEEIKSMMIQVAEEEDGTYLGIPLADLHNIETDLNKRREKERQKEVEERWNSYPIEVRYNLKRFHEYNLEKQHIVDQHSKELLELQESLISKYKQHIKYRKDILTDRKFILEHRSKQEPIFQSQRQAIRILGEQFVNKYQIDEYR